MITPDDTHTPPYATWSRVWGPTIALILIVMFVRLAYIAWFSPYALIEDEAHYWEWARHLALSYYSKGPGIAWTIAATTSLFGDTEFGVRVSAPVWSAIAAGLVALLAWDTSRDRRAAFTAAVLMHVVPIFQVLGILMTIDGPYVACWAAACWLAWRGMEKRSAAAWPVLGLVLGLGFLFKYTILLLPPALLLYAWRRRGSMHLPSLMPVRLALCAIGFAASIAPVLVWNAQNGWPTVRHLLGHLGLPGGDVPAAQSHAAGYHYELSWTLEYLGVQLLVVGPAMLLCVYSIGVAVRRRMVEPERWAGRLFLMTCGWPVLAFYLFVTAFTGVEGNWPAAGWITLIALSGWGVVDAMTKFNRRVAAWEALPTPRPKRGILRRRPETHRQIVWHAAVAVGIVSGVGMLRLDLLAMLPGVGSVVPVGRLTSARDFAESAAEQLARLREQGSEYPIAITQHYGRASQLAFYLPGQPTVFCASARMVGRRTQYDYWADTSLDRPDLAGRDALLLGATREQWAYAFDDIEEIFPLAGDHKERLAFFGFGYEGFSRQ